MARECDGLDAEDDETKFRLTSEVCAQRSCDFLLAFKISFGISTLLYRAFTSRMASSIHCTRSSKALRSVFATTKTQDLTLPAFLVPAFAPKSQPSHFSSSTRCRSKIGRAPLSLPPEVTFRILEAPIPKQGRTISRTEPSRKVEIEGPLGKMSMTIPAYISIAANEEDRTHALDISDDKDKKQKAMWGTYEPSPERV